MAHPLSPPLVDSNSWPTQGTCENLRAFCGRSKLLVLASVKYPVLLWVPLLGLVHPKLRRSLVCNKGVLRNWGTMQSSFCAISCPPHEFSKACANQLQWSPEQSFLSVLAYFFVYTSLRRSQMFETFNKRMSLNQPRSSILERKHRSSRGCITTPNSHTKFLAYLFFIIHFRLSIFYIAHEF